MVTKCPYPIMSVDNKDFYGAVVIIYGPQGFVGYDVIDYTPDHEWTRLNKK